MASEAARAAHVAALMGTTSDRWTKSDDNALERERQATEDARIAAEPELDRFGQPWRSDTGETLIEDEAPARTREQWAKDEPGEDAAPADPQRAALQQQREQLRAQFAAPPQVPAPRQYALPDPNRDPVGHILTRQANLENYASALQQQHAIGQLQHVVGAVAQHAVEDEKRLRSERPDYDAALDHLRASREKELESAGYTNPAQRLDMLRTEAFQLTAAAIQSGRSPAEAAYELAQARGFRGGPARSANELINMSDADFRRAYPNARGDRRAPTAARLLKMSDTDFLAAVDADPSLLGV
jgi:hypothetical protein